MQDDTDDFYLLLRDQQEGPFTRARIVDFLERGQVTYETLYWQDGLTEWLPLSTISDELEPAPGAPTVRARTSTSHARVGQGKPVHHAAGLGGSLELHEHKVIIRRSGARAFLLHGLAGDREILLAQISSVNLRKAGLLTNGFIQFAFLGGRESRQGILEATTDENTVMFNVSQQQQIEYIKEIIEQRIVARLAPQSIAMVSSSLDELEKLAALKERGIVTESEFQAKKRQILGL